MKRYVYWLTAAVLLLMIFGSLYAVVQQAERTGANFPQVQVAEDVASALNHGTKPEAITLGKVDMAASLAPFIIIYDQAGKVASGSGYLNNQVPTVPMGVLHASKGQDYYAVTWAPEATVRIASVTVAADKYYVLSGRNLREVEKNENKTLQLSLIAGAASWVVLVGAYVLVERLPDKLRRSATIASRS